MPANENKLHENEVLRRGESLRNGKLAFTLQNDGNLCLTYNGKYCWGTMTQDKDVQTATLQGDGNLALRNSNGDFIWGSMQNGGHMTMGRQPYVWLHDNGDVGIYASGDDGNRIWISGTQLIPFRAVHFLNDSAMVWAHPLIKDSDGNDTIWDGKGDNIDVLTPSSRVGLSDPVSVGWSDVVGVGSSDIVIDWMTAFYKRDGTEHHFRDDCSSVCKLGFNVVAGNNNWVDNLRFVYDEDSTNTVHILNNEKDASYHGISTNPWWDQGGTNDDPRRPDGIRRMPYYSDINR